MRMLHTSRQGAGFGRMHSLSALCILPHPMAMSLRPDRLVLVAPAHQAVTPSMGRPPAFLHGCVSRLLPLKHSRNVSNWSILASIGNSSHWKTAITATTSGVAENLGRKTECFPSLHSGGASKSQASHRNAMAPSSHAQSPRRQASIARAGLELPDAFKTILEQSLVREQQRMADQVGLPGLQIKSPDANGSGDATGAFVWTAGVQLSAYLTQTHEDQMRGKRVLEIGAGTGIVGITCACLGAHVQLTDLAAVLPLARSNVDLNAGLIEAAGGSALVSELEWSRPDPLILSQRFDYVMASDVTYRMASLPVLSNLLSRLLNAHSGTTVLLAHRHRGQALDQHMEETFASCGLELVRPEQGFPISRDDSGSNSQSGGGCSRKDSNDQSPARSSAQPMTDILPENGNGSDEAEEVSLFLVVKRSQQ